MIHQHSNDPVLIKKISLRIWSLRDEVESRIKEHLAQGSEPNSSPNSSKTDDDEASYLQGLISEYTPNASDSAGPGAGAPVQDNKPSLNLIKGGQKDVSATPEVTPEFGAIPGTDETATDVQAQSPTLTEVPTEIQVPSEVDPIATTITIRQKTPTIEPSKLCHGRTVLGEIHMDKMSFFVGRRFSAGQAIVIEFLIPKKFIVNADVLYCRHYSMKSRIISGQQLPYRLSVKFTFLKPGERTLLREFLESIEPDLSSFKKEVKPKKPTADADGLDDLSNLDL